MTHTVWLVLNNSYVWSWIVSYLFHLERHFLQHLTKWEVQECCEQLLDLHFLLAVQVWCLIPNFSFSVFLFQYVNHGHKQHINPWNGFDHYFLHITAIIWAIKWPILYDQFMIYLNPFLHNDLMATRVKRNNRRVSQ